MPRPAPNALHWNGRPGHYEVYYLTLTDGASGVGVWIRYTMSAPGESALWFVADDPVRGVIARKALRPIDELQARSGELRIGDAVLSDRGASGGFEDVAWDLRWTPSGRSYNHVHPVAERLGLVGSVLELPHADLAIEGVVSYDGTRLALQGARGGQAHIWGSKHADNWAWLHCSDLRDDGGEPVRDAFVDAVSVRAHRAGREIGPFTPVVGRFGGRDFLSTSPLRVLANWSTYALTGWRFEAIAGARKLIAQIDADRDRLAGVTYHDPDGDAAYCYNTETASIRLHLYERAPRVGGWAHAAAFAAQGRAHFEYAQRTPVPDQELHLT
ncbi:MAG TPA: hypothetical protein VJU80_16465 [Solirubrobacteraceae bacterium]|nr:hypothetical protein [Solirubrobacteraceae bacterium]